MKMFWKLMLAIFVILGTTACTNSSVDSVGGDSEFFSFIASIESTRTDMVNNDGIWQTIWSGDDKLLVTSDSGNFVFTNSKEEPARFVSTDVEAVALGDATNIVITTLHENGSVVDSDAGKCGIGLRQEYARFPKSGVVSLDIQSAFFRLACDYDVTISAGDAIFSGINESSNLETKITLNAGDDIWVALNPCVEKTSVAIMVGDESVLTIGELELKHCVIYNFGKIVPKVVPEPEPEPEPEDAVVYLVPNDEWRGSSAWFAAYLWSDNEEVDVRLTDEEGDGIYSAIIPRSMTNIIFCRMNPAYTEFGWNSDSESDRVWAMTADLAVGVAPNNYFYVTSESDGVWGSATYDPNLPVGQPSNWAVAGTFNNWSDDIMYITAVENIFVKQSLTLKAGEKFKIKSVGSWDIDYGAGVNNLMPNMWIAGVSRGSNIVVSKSGTYDIYFDSSKECIYLMKEGISYTSATEQTENGDDPQLADVSWGLCGTHNDWGNGGVKDTVLQWDTTIELYVAYNAKLTGEFKVRANNSWGNDYGSDDWVSVNSVEGQPMKKSGGNCRCDSGTFDVYFDLANKLIWVRTPGSAAPAN